MKLSTMLLALATLVSSPSFARGGGGGGGGGGGSGGSDKPICTGFEPPRLGAPYEAKPSFDAKVDAYRAATAQYEVDHPAAAAFAREAADLTGRSCEADADCATSDESKYHGSCQRYVWDGTNGSCVVNSLIVIPPPPAPPVFACADVICPSNFKCEVEENNGAVGCVENRTCRLP